MGEERYSDKRLRDEFTIYVLFSEPLEGTVSELLEAAAEDYPGLDWTFENLGPDEINTRSVTMAVDFAMPDPTLGMTRITGMPGRCEVNWAPVFEMSRLVNPEAQEAVARHTDHLSIAVSAPKDNTSLPARFHAARRMTCLGAVLAKLPTCLGVYFPSADILVPPQAWAEAAEKAVKGEFPVFQWIAIYANHFEADASGVHPVTVGTVGMAAFNGHELVMPQARIPAPEAANWVYCAARMMLEADHVFGDGNTLGVEGGDKPIRLRHVAEGRLKMQTDTWVMFHESSPLDDEELLGERALKPPPPGYDNAVRGDWSSLKNKLYSFVAGGR